eukprot:scaffold613_cov243-Pinguiococcus_pyrenoidosus.AAC.45
MALACSSEKGAALGSSWSKGTSIWSSGAFLFAGMDSMKTRYVPSAALEHSVWRTVSASPTASRFSLNAVISSSVASSRIPYAVNLIPQSDGGRRSCEKLGAHGRGSTRWRCELTGVASVRMKESIDLVCLDDKRRTMPNARKVLGPVATVVLLLSPVGVACGSAAEGEVVAVFLGCAAGIELKLDALRARKPDVVDPVHVVVVLVRRLHRLHAALGLLQMAQGRQLHGLRQLTQGVTQEAVHNVTLPAIGGAHRLLDALLQRRVQALLREDQAHVSQESLLAAQRRC